MAGRAGPRSRASGYLRWLVFYVGFALSPLTPGNDAIVNQIPASVLAAALSRYGPLDYDVLYPGFYIGSNILGILMMLANLDELYRRWRRLRSAFREDRRRFACMLLLDALSFISVYIAGRLVTGLLRW
jgi:hypothetical protein